MPEYQPKLVADFRDSNWIDLSAEHNKLREQMENWIRECCVDLKESPAIMIRGDFRIGKSQLLYHLVHHAWRTNVPAFYCTLGDIVRLCWEPHFRKSENRMSKDEAAHFLNEYIKNYRQEFCKSLPSGPRLLMLPQGEQYNGNLEGFLTTVKHPKIVDKDGKETEYKPFDLSLISAAMADNNKNKSLLVVDEFEESYSKINKYIESEGGGALRKLFEDLQQNNTCFQMLIACGPTTGLELRGDESASSGRIYSKQMPAPDARAMNGRLLHNATSRGELNGLWWLGRARPGQIIRVHNQLVNRADNYLDFIDHNTFLKEELVDATVPYWNDSAFVKMFDSIAKQNAMYKLLLSVAPIDKSADISDSVLSELGTHLMCAKETIEISAIIDALNKDLKREFENPLGGGNVVEYSELQTEIAGYFFMILRHMADQADRVCWNSLKTERDRVFKDSVMLPLLRTVHDQLYLHRPEDKTHKYLHEFIDKLATANNAADLLEETRKLFTEVDSCNDIRYLQATPSVLRAVLEQPIGAPDLYYRGKCNADRLQSLNSTAQQPNIPPYILYEVSHKPWSNKVYIVPADLQGQNERRYLSALARAIKGGFTETDDKHFRVTDKITVLCLDDKPTDSVKQSVDEAQRMSPQKKWNIDCVGISEIPSERPEHLRAFLQSLCLISVTETDFREDLKPGVMLKDICEKLAVSSGASRELRRAVDYYDKQVIEGDLKSFFSKALKNFEKQVIDDLAVTHFKSLYKELGDIISGIWTGQEMLVPVLSLAVSHQNEDEDKLLNSLRKINNFDRIEDTKFKERLKIYSAFKLDAVKPELIEKLRMLLRGSTAEKLKSFVWESEYKSPANNQAWEKAHWPELYLEPLLLNLPEQKKTLAFFIRGLSIARLPPASRQILQQRMQNEFQKWEQQRAEIKKISDVLCDKFARPILNDPQMERFLDEVCNPLREWLNRPNTSEAGFLVSNLASDVIAVGDALYKIRTPILPHLQQLEILAKNLFDEVAGYQQRVNACLSDPIGMKSLHVDRAKHEEFGFAEDDLDDLWKKKLCNRISFPDKETGWEIADTADTTANLIEKLNKLQEKVTKLRGEKEPVSKCRLVTETLEQLRDERNNYIESVIWAAEAFRLLSERQDIDAARSPANFCFPDLLDELKMKCEHPDVILQVREGNLSEKWTELAAKLKEASDCEQYEKVKKELERAKKIALDLLRSPLVLQILGALRSHCSYLQQEQDWLGTSELEKKLKDAYKHIEENIKELPQLIQLPDEIKLFPMLRESLSKTITDTFRTWQQVPPEELSQWARDLSEALNKIKQLHAHWLFRESDPYEEMPEEWRKLAKVVLANLPGWTRSRLQESEPQARNDVIQLLESAAKALDNGKAIYDRLTTLLQNLKDNHSEHTRTAVKAWLMEAEQHSQDFNAFAESLENVIHALKKYKQVCDEFDNVKNDGFDDCVTESEKLGQYRDKVRNYRSKFSEFLSTLPDKKFKQIDQEIRQLSGLEQEASNFRCEAVKDILTSNNEKVSRIRTLQEVLRRLDCHIDHDKVGEIQGLSNRIERFDDLDGLICKQVSFLVIYEKDLDEYEKMLSEKLEPEAIRLWEKLNSEKRIPLSDIDIQFKPAKQLQEKGLADIVIKLKGTS